MQTLPFRFCWTLLAAGVLHFYGTCESFSLEPCRWRSNSHQIKAESNAVLLSSPYYYSKPGRFVSPLHAKAGRKDDSDDVSSSNLSWLQHRFNFSEEWRRRVEVGFNERVDDLNRTAMIERVDWLQQRLNLSHTEMATIIRKQQFALAMKVDTMSSTLRFYEERLGLRNKSLARFIQKHPQLLYAGVGSGQSVQRNLDWIQNRLYLNNTKIISNKTISKFVLQYPTVLSLSVENNLDPKFNALQKRLGLNETQVARLCIKWPPLLGMSYSTNIGPTLDWLQNRLDLDEQQLGKMVSKHPTIISSNPEEKIEPNLKWLQERLCLDAEAVRAMAIRQPGLMGGSTSMKMEPCLAWFSEQFPELDQSALGWIMRQQPSLLCYSISNNLEPTLQFYKDCIGNEAASILVLKKPRVLLSSLEKRLKPRLKEAQEYGIEIDAGCVQRMAIWTERRWHASLLYQEEKIACSVE